MKHIRKMWAPCEGERRSGLAVGFHIFVAEETRGKSNHNVSGKAKVNFTPIVLDTKREKLFIT